MRRAIFGVGAIAFAVAFAIARDHAHDALFATWRPFVLVAGLLLVGLAAHENGVFDALGRGLARAPLGPTGFVVAGLLVVAAVTAVLNLDTAAAFVTPVLLVGVAHRGNDRRDDRLLYGSLLMCNAASLLLPGSNLTNLIVLSSEHRSGSDFAAAMWPAFVAAVVVTAAFVVWMPRARHEDEPAAVASDDPATIAAPPRRGTGACARVVSDRVVSNDVVGIVAIAAIVAVVVLMLSLSDPAAAVFLVGAAMIALEVACRRIPAWRAIDTVDPALLAGLFGIAVALGTLGRSWHWPSHVLESASPAGTAAIAALASIALNNLPSAALLAARPVAHPRALLVGLNIGPNLAVSGSLSALLWYRTARTVGARPRMGEISRLGVIVVPLSIAAALVALRLMGTGAL